MKTKKIITYSIVYLLIGILSLIVIFPLIYTFFCSLKSNMDILTAGTKLWPEEFVWENYVTAWVDGNFGSYMWNSIMLTTVVMTGVIINCTIGGYVFSRGEFRGKKFLWSLFTLNMLFSLGTMTILPQFKIANFLGITGLTGVMIVRIFGINVANLMIMKGFVDSIPREIDEAAMVDGCSFFRIYWNIIFPLLAPIIATVGLISFKQTWNDYLLPMIFTMSVPDQSPLIVGIMKLKTAGESATSWNLMLAGSMLSIAPMLIIYTFLKKFFIAGLTSGSVKG